VTLSLGQFFVAGFLHWRRQRMSGVVRLSRLQQLRNTTQIARLNSQLTVDIAGKLSSWRVMEVAKVIDQSLDTKSFYLVDPNQQPLPSFSPGQYLMVRPALAGKYQATRCYSISVAPNGKLWRITVKRQADELALKSDRKNGGLSNWLHHHIHDGDCLLIGGPSGHFVLPAELNNAPIVLLAAGVGITPMVSMLQYSVHFTPRRPVTLYFQARDVQHWPLGAEAHGYCKQAENCRVISYFSRESLSELNQLSARYPGEFRAGKYAIAAIVGQTSDLTTHYFLCGPDAWMAQQRDQLLAGGVTAERIHWESFGADATPVSPQPQTAEKTFEVSFRQSQVKAVCDPSDQSLWEVAQANEVVIPSGCLNGVCGSCRVKLLQGTVRYDRKIAVSLSADECLACVARPTSNVELDA
jgi:uncharacterized protein